MFKEGLGISLVVCLTLSAFAANDLDETEKVESNKAVHPSGRSGVS